jgi:hypothetical protein
MEGSPPVPGGIKLPFEQILIHFVSPQPPIAYWRFLQRICRLILRHQLKMHSNKTNFFMQSRMVAKMLGEFLSHIFSFPSAFFAWQACMKVNDFMAE